MEAAEGQVKGVKNNLAAIRAALGSLDFRLFDLHPAETRHLLGCVTLAGDGKQLEPMALLAADVCISIPKVLEYHGRGEA